MIIGITGNSGVGKSYLINNLTQDFFIIDADVIGHNVLLMPKCKEEVLNFFGEDILEKGEIVRKKLGEIVFLDKEKLSVLTEITHRYIKEEINKLILENINNYKLIIIDAALLVESGLSAKCDKTILVTADFDVKVSKIMERDNISEEIAVGRLKKQASDEIQQKNVDIVFENSYNLKAIEKFNNIIKNIMELYV